MYYVPKSINFNVSNPELDKYVKYVYFEPLGEKIAHEFFRIAEDIHNNRLGDPDSYKLNIYDELGIEDYSYLDKYNLRPIHESIVRILEAYPEQYKFCFPNILFFCYASQPENFFVKINTTLPLGDIPHEAHRYKIHLMVKSDYIVYAFVKLSLVLKDFEFDGKKYLHNVKANFNSRSHFPNLPDGESPGNVSLLDDTGNGGAAPSIVIYASTDPKYTVALIKYIINAFKDDIARIGLMDDVTDKPQRVPTFNIRLNSLVAYALGDRANKLDARISRKKAPHKRDIYTIPEWLIREVTDCTENKDRINRKSQSWFGTNICSDLDNETYRYLGHVDKDMISPYDILSVVPTIKGGTKKRKTLKKKKFIRNRE